MVLSADLLLLTFTLAVATLVLLVLYLEQLRDMRGASREEKTEVAVQEERARSSPPPIASDPRASVTYRAPLESSLRTRIRGSVLIDDDGPDDPLMASDDTLESPLRMSLDAAPLVSELANDPDIADIVADFVNVLGSRADALMTAFRRDDTPTLKRLVHQLKGSAGGYGFPSISEQARQVEAALEASKDRGQVKHTVDALCTLCFRACLGVATERTPRAVA